MTALAPISLVKDLWNLAPTYATDNQIKLFLEIAHDWLVDSLQGKIIPPSSPSDTSYSWKLAEAYYCMYLICNKFSSGSTTIETLGFEFHSEAYRLMTHLRDRADFNAGIQDGIQSTSTNIEPQFTRGKYDENGILIGNIMGKANNNKGSLDDW